MKFPRADWRSEVKKTDQQADFALIRVRYDEDEQRQTVRTFLDYQIREIEFGESLGDTPWDDPVFDNARMMLAHASYQTLQSMTAVFKSRVFEKEREWRIACVRQPRCPMPVNHRARGNVVHPYVEIDVSVERDGHMLMPISQVIAGPTSSSNLEINGIVSLLQSYGYPNPEVMVQPSGVPLRKTT